MDRASRTVAAAAASPAAAAALVFVLAAAGHLAFAVWFPGRGGDTDIYFRVAENILRNGCLSMSEPEPGLCVPDWGGNQPPGYPAFVALVWRLAGHADLAIPIAQGVLIAAVLAWMFAGVRRLIGRPGMALTIGLIAAVSPLHLAVTRTLLSEPMAVILSLLVFAELVHSAADGRLRIWTLGAALGAAMLVRFDLVFLCVPVAVAAVLLHSRGDSLRRGVVIAVIAALPAGTWIARNVLLGLSPLRPAVVLSDLSPAPVGYLSWAQTWHDSQYLIPGFYYPLNSHDYSGIVIPASAYADAAEKARVDALLAELRSHDGGAFPSGIDARFAELARERRARLGWRYWLLLPARRTVSQWLTPFHSYAFPIELDIVAEQQIEVRDRGSTLVGLALANPGAALGKAAVNGYRYLVLLAFAAAVFLAARGRLERGVAIIVWSALAFALARHAYFVTTMYAQTRHIFAVMPALELAALLALAARAAPVWRNRNR